MKYLVMAIMFKDGKNKTDFWSFFELDDAKDFADWKAKKLKEHGYEFDVAIYERTSY